MRRFVNSLALVFASGALGCVTTGTHEAVVNELAKTKKELADTTSQRDEAQAKADTCNENLTLSRDENTQLVSKVESMGKSMGALSKEKKTLIDERMALAKEVAELKRIRAAAEKREQEYRQLMSKLQKMVDAGTLEVKVRNGRMLVQLSSDVVFPPGGTRIKPEASEALRELAAALSQFEDRKFQVVGHSDATPIHTARFPSNWELSSQRAIEVVKLLVAEGVPPEIISAAGNAEFDPLIDSDLPEDLAKNRRVEVVFVPKIDELPGFDNLGK
jgi:chemotaxis protein MotB